MISICHSQHAVLMPSITKSICETPFHNAFVEHISNQKLSHNKLPNVWHVCHCTPWIRQSEMNWRTWQKLKLKVFCVVLRWGQNERLVAVFSKWIDGNTLWFADACYKNFLFSHYQRITFLFICCSHQRSVKNTNQ